MRGYFFALFSDMIKATKAPKEIINAKVSPMSIGDTSLL